MRAPARAQLRMTIDIDYLTRGVGIEELKDKLEHLAQHGMDDGLITGDTGAEVSNFRCHVESITRQTPVVDLEDLRLLASAAQYGCNAAYFSRMQIRTINQYARKLGVKDKLPIKETSHGG